MQWDTRVWSFFVFVISYIMYIAALATPYNIKGNPVHYGPDTGLWKEEGETEGYKWVTKILLIVGVACLAISMIIYLLLFKYHHHHTILHHISYITQAIGGALGVTAGGLYAGNSHDIKGDGMWMSICSGLIFIVNSMVVACIPYTQFEIRRKKISDDDVLEALKKRNIGIAGTAEEKVALKKVTHIDEEQQARKA